MISDASQRIRALDPEKSFIVQAPAGSGKTELLIQRFLKLLSGVQYPEQILAMTFTRKASGEMKTRILKALERAEDTTPPLSSHERHTWNLARSVIERDRKFQWRLRDNPSRLKIQTIDSFCLGLNQQTPLLSRLGALPVLEENPLELYRKTANRLLKKVESNNEVARSVEALLIHLDNSKKEFLDRIISLLQKRDQWFIPFFGPLKVTNESRKSLENILKRIIESGLEKTSTYFSNIEHQQLIRFCIYAAQNIRGKNPKAEICALEGIESFPGSKVENLSQWKGLAQLLLSRDGCFREQVNALTGFPCHSKEQKEMKNDFINFLKTLSLKNELRKNLNEIRFLPHPQFTDKEWGLLQSFLILLPEMENLLRETFNETGKTDFAEISLSALQALGSSEDPTDLLLKLDIKLQHILVDEYQDTSFKQYTLLAKLTAGWTPRDGRTLFIVGDPMQSIFRFRDAEVSLFLKTRENGLREDGVSNVHLESLTLTSNFRSEPGLVRWINNCFSEVFPKKNDPALGKICYSPSTAIKGDSLLNAVVIHPLREINPKQEALQIVRIVQEIKKDHPNESIAILARAKVHLEQIILAFRENGILYRAEEIHKLSTRQVILDLLALLNALLSFADRSAWLSILRAPWCGLTLRDIYCICENDEDSSVWSLIHNEQRTRRLSEDGQIRLDRFKTVLSKVLDAKSFYPLRDVLEGGWIALGGPACISSMDSKENELRDVEVFFQKISQIQESGELSRLQNFKREIENLFAFPGIGSSSAVQMMTMHKAKGLEFDHVILPGLGHQPKMVERRILFWMPFEEDFLLAPAHAKGDENFKIYDYLSRLDREKDVQESIRLLYVATTRAKKRLHLLGHIQTNKKGHPKPKMASLLESLWPYLRREWPIKENTQETNSEKSETQKTHQTLYRLPTTHNFSFNNKPDYSQKNLTIIGNKDIPQYIWAGNLARCIGKVLHAAYENISRKGEIYWNSFDKKDGILKAALLNEGLPYNQIDSALSQAKKFFSLLKEDKTAQWILKPHEDHKSEFSISGIVNGDIQNRHIDRTFIDENKVRWIIDYKTGEHEGANLDHFFSEEKKRYQTQLDVYELLIRQSGETRPIKKALFYPMHRKLLELS